MSDDLPAHRQTKHVSYALKNKGLIVQQNLADHRQNIKISFLTNIFCWQHRLAVSEAVNSITCRGQCEEQLAGLADAVSKKVCSS